MPISKMYIGECQNWPHSSEGDFLHFETPGTCEGSNPNNLPWQYPNPGDGTFPFGDTGWFVSTNATSVPDVNNSYYWTQILWKGEVVNRYWVKNHASYLYLSWRGFNVNNNSDIFFIDADYDEPLGYASSLGWMYRLDYDRDSQVPADVLTEIVSSPGPIYTGCIKRIRFKYFVPDLPFPLDPNGESRPHENPSVACGAPYGDGYFQGQNRTIIIADGQEVYNQPGNPSTVVVNGFKYIKQGTQNITDLDGNGYLTFGYGWGDNNSCGYTAPPNAGAVEVSPFIKVFDV